MKMRLSILVLAILPVIATWATTDNASALEIERVEMKQGAYDCSKGYSVPPCDGSGAQWEEQELNIFVSGEISIDDDKLILKQVNSSIPNRHDGLSDFFPRITIYLNSQGGSALGGIKLAKLFRQQGFRTWVSKDAKCLSACAIAFMSGSYNGTHGYTAISRILEPGGLIGFHAPFFPPETKPSYTSEELSSIQRSGALTTSFLLSVNDEDFFPKQLLAEMFAEGPDELRLIRNVDDLGRYTILPSDSAINFVPDAEELAYSCLNWLAWRNRESALSEYSFGQPREFPHIDWQPGAFPVERTSDSKWKQTPAGEMQLPKLMKKENGLKYYRAILNVSQESMASCVIDYATDLHATKSAKITLSYLWEDKDLPPYMGDDMDVLRRLHFLYPATAY